MNQSHPLFFRSVSKGPVLPGGQSSTHFQSQWRYFPFYCTQILGLLERITLCMSLPFHSPEESRRLLANRPISNLF